MTNNNDPERSGNSAAITGSGGEKAEKADDPGRRPAVLADSVICRNDEGSCLIIEKVYPVSFIYGGYRLEELTGSDMGALELACGRQKNYGNDETAAIYNASDLVFFDTETTGLSGGAGTVAFLAGIGFFREDHFIVRQYFMRDYDEEPAMLFELNKVLSSYKNLVTFNGKAFDWNIINGRYIANRMRLGMRDPCHFDLLFPARRLWKMKLESCRLSSLEDNILNEPRFGDIPGEMIPGIYFNYLETGDTGDLERVITHNRLDVLSLVSLAARISEIIADPVKASDGGYELLGAAGIHQAGNAAAFGVAEELYSECTASGNDHVCSIASKKLAGIYKKSGRVASAAEIWESIRIKDGVPDIHAVVELAKYYEHKLKEYEMAASLVQEALTYLRSIYGHVSAASSPTSSAASSADSSSASSAASSASSAPSSPSGRCNSSANLFDSLSWRLKRLEGKIALRH